MQPPFTTDQFLGVFRSYNDGIFPMQLVLVALAIAAVLIAAGSRKEMSAAAGRVVSAILAVLWLWMGVAYHIVFFRQINPLAIGFGLLFIVEGAALLWIGGVRGHLTFRPAFDWRSLTGWGLIIFSLIVYPLLAYAFGQRYPAMPTFGLPCPTTIFTIGLLFWSPPARARIPAIIPIVWSALGLSAATTLGIREDFGLVAAGLLGLMLWLPRRLRPAIEAERAHTIVA